jgi:hypothetical protein
LAEQVQAWVPVKPLRQSCEWVRMGQVTESKLSCDVVAVHSAQCHSEEEEDASATTKDKDVVAALLWLHLHVQVLVLAYWYSN